MDKLPPYAELMAMSHFSFQMAASSPQDMVQRAYDLGYSAIALADLCSVAGVVRAHVRAKELGMAFIPASSFAWSDGWRLVALPQDKLGWGQLCEFITLARGSGQPDALSEGLPRVDKAHVRMPSWQYAAGHLQHCVHLLIPPRLALDETCTAYPHQLSPALSAIAQRITQWCALAGATPVRIGAVLHQAVDDDWWQHCLWQLERATQQAVVLVGDARIHVRSSKPLLDVVNAIGLGRSVQQCGDALHANAQMHLRSRLHVSRLVPEHWLSRSVEVAQLCHFSLDHIRYQYPREVVQDAPAHESPAHTLTRLVQEGLCRRYTHTPDKVQAQVSYELALITELGYEMYFLTVYDLVRFARSRGILCQGRGSAANSAVCYALGITEVDPARSVVLFERFISRARKEPPDIDVDFEHQRREEVIQYMYSKYGRHRCTIAATVMTYRPRSALRDVGKALGIEEPLIAAMSKAHPGMYARAVQDEWLDTVLSKLGMAHASAQQRAHWQLWLDLSRDLLGAPRQLGQHSGGFVLTDGPLSQLVPIENARMPHRSLIQWDKDDLDAVGLLKVDVLALGMLSAIKRCLAFMSQRYGRAWRMQDIPSEDSATYAMLSRAQSIGVFQVESRAQMSMLPRLKPTCFYDLVVQVAIVRPGPIQGGMVHPYLRRRQGLEPVSYPSAALKEALGRTLGVPIFQEQVMQIAMLAAGFSADEADQLRRSMAAWKRKGGVHKFYERIVSGMVAHGHTVAFAEQIFKQIEGFGEYGFPESHAASFALLVYVSAWMKCHEPACFLAALLNSLPMGFYGPSQLVQDAQRQGVVVHPVDVLLSDWDCSLCSAPVDTQPAVRLGLCLASGLSASAGLRIVQARDKRVFESIEDLVARAQLDAGDIKALANADALQTLAGHRRMQLWQASVAHLHTPLLNGQASDDDINSTWQAHTHIAPLLLGEQIAQDYNSIGLSLKGHPVALVRAELSRMRIQTAETLQRYRNGKLAKACGLVTVRQKPGTAKGVLFITLEDETGVVNVVVWQSVQTRQRAVVMHAKLMAVYGVWQRDTDPTTGQPGRVCHLVAQHVVDMTAQLQTATAQDVHLAPHEFH